MTNSIHQFIRASRQMGNVRKGDPIGITLATVAEGEIRIGWSQTNLKAGDRFSKEKGLLAAASRAQRGSRKSIPYLARQSAEDLARRARKYFKVDSVALAGADRWVQI